MLIKHGFDTGRSAVWLAHLPWEQGVGGSNPLAPIFSTADPKIMLAAHACGFANFSGLRSSSPVAVLRQEAVKPFSRLAAFFLGLLAQMSISHGHGGGHLSEDFLELLGTGAEYHHLAREDVAVMPRAA